MFAHKRIRILHSSRLPPRFREIMRKQLYRRPLLLVPRCHPPEALEDRLFLECKIVNATVNRVLPITLGVLISSNDFELLFLSHVLVSQNMSKS